MQADVAMIKGERIRICEIYPSIQGEGLLTGTPSLFIRTSGCNLRCWFCDTPFASWHPEGDYLSVSEVLRRIDAFTPSHAVVTGGEPMIYSGLPGLVRQLRERGMHVTIETAGTLWMEIVCDLWSISPKLSSSAPLSPGRWQTLHQQRRQRLDVVGQMMRSDYQLKFVVNDQRDAQDVIEYLEMLPVYERERVLLMPQGVTVQDLQQREVWLKPFCAQHGFVYCPRSHIQWFGNRRGT